MPITVEIVDDAPHNVLERVFNYFAAADERFSLYKETSEINALNKRRISYGNPGQFGAGWHNHSTRHGTP